MRPRNRSRLITYRLFCVTFCLLTGLFSNGCGAGSPYISSLTVTPGSQSLALGTTAQFTVMAHWTDGAVVDETSSVTWSTSDTSIAAVSSRGLVTTLAVGNATVIAKLNGRSGTASLAVGKAALTAISITAPTSPIPLGLSAQLKASGTYTDKSVADITNSVTWGVAQSGVVAVNAAGLAVSQSAGSTQVTASLSSINASASVAVGPAALSSIAVQGKEASLPLGSSEQFTAIGNYTDGSTMDLTLKVGWTSSAPGVAPITSAGTASAKSAGNASIAAALSGISGAANLSVTSAALVSIAVNAGHPSLPLGTGEQLTATGTYTDGTTRDLTASATWTTSSPAVLSVAGGAIQTKSAGAAAVSASSSSITGSTNLTVTAPQLLAITVSAASTSVPVGESLQLNATGTYSDGSTQDLTGTSAWRSSSSTVLNLHGPGLVSGLAVGAATVTASSGSISGMANLSVSAPALSSLALTPAAPTVPLGTSLQLAVTGTFSDGSTQDVTSQVVWSIDNSAIASISSGGAVTGLQVGTANIEASLNGVQTGGLLTVQPVFAVGYYDATSSVDTSIRITNPGTTGQDLCSMIYVFDQDQQLSECCGCLVSQDGLLTLSLKKNLLTNPLTGVPSKTGTVVVVSADQQTTGGCNAAAMTPAGTIIAWGTHLSQSGQMSSSETPFSSSPLSSTLAGSLQAQCAFVQQLGSGQGICGCGSGQN